MIALRRPRRDLVWLALIVVLAVLPALPPVAQPTQSTVTVQPNVEERDNWTRPEVDTLHQRLEILTLQAGLSNPKPDVVLWPEMPAPMYYFQDTKLRDRVHTLRACCTRRSSSARSDSRTNIEFGIPLPRSGHPVNSRADTTKSSSSHSANSSLFPFQGLVDKITNEIGDFEPGDRVSTFDLGTHKLGAFICYESAIRTWCANSLLKARRCSST